MTVRERILTLRILERLFADPTLATDLGIELTHEGSRRDSGEDLPANSVIPHEP